MAQLILVRHGVSEWNKLDTWTGWTDVGLADEGFEEAILKKWLGIERSLYEIPHQTF